MFGKKCIFVKIDVIKKISISIKYYIEWWLKQIIFLLFSKMLKQIRLKVTITQNAYRRISDLNLNFL